MVDGLSLAISPAGASLGAGVQPSLGYFVPDEALYQAPVSAR